MEFKSLLLLSLAAVSAVDPYLPTIFISATTLDDLELDESAVASNSVSYTHLTLPTIA